MNPEIRYTKNRVFVDFNGKRFIFHSKKTQEAEEFYNSLCSKAGLESASSSSFFEEPIDEDMRNFEVFNGVSN